MATNTTRQEEEAARNLFFTSKHFAVAGASSNPNKFGHIVFKWYIDRSIPVTPINPGSASITVGKAEYATVSSPSELGDPASTSLSVITPPAVTRELLKEAKQCGIRALWLQPGTYDRATLEYAFREFPGAVVAGCILTTGNNASLLAGFSM